MRTTGKWLAVGAPLHVRDARVHGEDDREVARGGGSGLTGGRPRGDGPGGVAARPVSMCSHSGSRTAVAPIQRPGLAAASSPPRSCHTSPARPHRAALPPRRAPGRQRRHPRLRVALLPLHRQWPGPLGRVPPGRRRSLGGGALSLGRPRSRAGCQHSRAASSSSVMCPGATPARHPTLKTVLKVIGALRLKLRAEAAPDSAAAGKGAPGT